MSFQTLPSYLSPGAAPSGSDSASQFLHSLRTQTGCAVRVLEEAQRSREAFEKCTSGEKRKAEAELGIPAKELIEAAEALIGAIPKPKPKAIKEKS